MKQFLSSRRLLLMLFLTTTICSFLFGTANYGQAGEEGLTGFWNFDEGIGEAVKDSSGNSNDGTIHGAKWVKGISGNALSFNGTDDYVDCGNRLNLWVDNFTIEAWIKTDSAKSNDTIVDKVETTGIPYFSFLVESAGQTRAYISKGGGDSNTAADWAVGSTNVVDGKWHYVAGVFDRTNSKIQVYVDGTPDRSGNIQNVTKDISMTNKGNLIIGARYNGTSGFFPGVIDELGIYKKALSGEEIKKHYNNKRPAGRSAAVSKKPLAVTKAPPVKKPMQIPEIPGVQSLRFGISADPHFRIGWTHTERAINNFVNAMIEWKPDFVIDLGDFAIEVKEGQTTPEMHDGQIKTLISLCSIFSKVPCPHYNVMGNHDAGWLKGGEEIITPDDLYNKGHGGEDITKDEWIAHTKMPHRYYSFDVKGYHFIVLDGNNPRSQTTPPGHDGVIGAYGIDDTQKLWLAEDLAANRKKVKIVFCHEELHHTPPEGSGEGGDVPFPPVGKERSYIDNGWQLREMFTADGKVLVCFFGHKHRSRWTVYGGVNYITLAQLCWENSYAKVTISDKLYIEGVGNQKSYTLTLNVNK